jgi:simple sugar transport system permease protein
MAVTSGTPETTQPRGPAPRRGAGGPLGLGKRFLTLREGSIVVVTIIAIVYFAAKTSRFTTLNSFKTLLPFFAPYAILGAAEVFVMINGEIDLSIGSMYLFIPFWFDKIDGWGLGLYPSLILALISAAALGAANGFAVAYIGISSFVTTLGTLFALAGLTLVISHATPITPPGTSLSGQNTYMAIFGHGTYSELIWAVAIVIVLQVILLTTRWGTYTVAVGSNRIGAAEAGIRVKANLMRNFMVCALLAGFVGILETTRATSATPDPSGANNFLFLGISAAVIGGTLLQGGSGTVVGALIGALFLGILNDGLTITGVSANYLDLYLGLAIVIAMVINTYISRVRKGSGRG